MSNNDWWIKEGGAAFPGQQRRENDGQWNQTFDPGISVFDLVTIVAMHALIQREQTHNRDALMAQARQFAYTFLEMKEK